MFLSSLPWNWAAKGSNCSREARKLKEERERERASFLLSSSQSFFATEGGKERKKEKQKTHLPQLAGAAAPPDLAGLARVPRLEVAGALGGSALAVVGGAPVVAVEEVRFFFSTRE